MVIHTDISIVQVGDHILCS